jgi:hypothetical protein
MRLSSDAPIKSFVHYVYWGLFLVIATVGFWACQDIGLGWDEGHERLTLNHKLRAIEGLLTGDTAAYQALLAYGDRYYGIGFHLPAFLLGDLLQTFIPTTANGPKLILAHISVWLCFLVSGYLVKCILQRITQNRLVANTGMVTYLLWPYVLGHGLMNIKDTPFLFAWLLCTYLALRCFFGNASAHRSSSRPPYKSLFLLAIATSWLLSIRISGILIFIEYGCLLICAYAVQFTNGQFLITGENVKAILARLFFFGLICLPTFIALYPISWHNPLEILNAISYMSHHPWSGTTLTAGRFIAPGQQVDFYLMVWLLAKTPLIIIAGIAAIPLAFFLQWRVSKLDQLTNKSILAQWIGLVISVIVILTALIVNRVGLYNELRQVLFLFPIIFIVGICSLYFISKKICLISMLLSSALFIWDNFTLYPYNYSYLNEIARLRPATQYFETDYFGFSAGRSARWINNHPQEALNKCIYAYPTHLVENELDAANKPCLIDSQGNAYNLKKDVPSLLFITQRNLINFPIPEGCRLIHSEERTLPFSKNPLIMGRLFNCY